MSLHISPFSVATNALVLSLAGIASAQNLGGLDTPPQAKTDTTKATENTSSILIKTEENSQDTTNEKTTEPNTTTQETTTQETTTQEATTTPETTKAESTDQIKTSQIVQTTKITQTQVETSTTQVVHYTTGINKAKHYYCCWNPNNISNSNSSSG